MNQFSLSPQISRYKISRRGRKLQISDDPRTIIALPKDVSERTWAEIMQKEETDLVVLDMREEILEEALRIGYERYMERQVSPFTVYCTGLAWLKLIDWHFYRHDPGEEPSAHPLCYIPKRIESWQPDQLPNPSPKDTWLKHEITVVEDTSEEPLPRCVSSTSLDYPVVEEIPQEYWFPGKVELEGFVESKSNVEQEYSSVSYVWHGMQESGFSDYVQEESRAGELATDSEMLQKVTDYSDELSKKVSQLSGMKNTTPVEGSLQGAGDSNVNRLKKKHWEKSKVFSRISVSGRSRCALPPLSRSRVSTISDCRLRNLRLDTQYEISSEKMDTPPGETIKRR